LKLGFIHILIETCKGTAVYYHVLRQSPIKAFLHFLLLCILCTGAVWLYNLPFFNRQINKVYEKINASCGPVALTENGLLPQKDPKTNRMIFSMPKLELTYIGDINAEIPKIDIGLTEAGIIWMPKVIIQWNRREDNNYLLYSIINGDSVKFQVCEKDQLVNCLKEANLDAGKGKVDTRSPYLNMLQNPLLTKASVAIGGFIGFFIVLFLQYLFFILMVSLIFSALGSRRLQGKLFFRDYFVLNCYIAFPCILISAIWLAVQPPFLNFQWVSILSFSIYFMIVMSRIERWLSPPPPENEPGE